MRFSAKPKKRLIEEMILQMLLRRFPRFQAGCQTHTTLCDDMAQRIDEIRIGFKRCFMA